MTPIPPYEAYERAARGAARKRYARAWGPLMIALALFGGGVGAFFATESRIVTGLLGAAIGAAAGLGIHQILVWSKTTSDAEAAYASAWCTQYGLRYIGDDYEIANGPFATSGHNRQWTDAIEGQVGGLMTLFYNYSYHTTQSSGKSSREVEHPFKVMRIMGPQLPVASLAFSRRGMFGEFEWLDKLDSALTNQRDIELESVDFNETFKLEVSDTADEIWIRRVFDPETIDALVSGRMQFPNISYWDGCFWLWENRHFKIKELDALLPWQAVAVPAVAHLSRVR
jgi:hypothetical protein